MATMRNMKPLSCTCHIKDYSGQGLENQTLGGDKILGIKRCSLHHYALDLFAALANIISASEDLADADYDDRLEHAIKAARPTFENAMRERPETSKWLQ